MKFSMKGLGKLKGDLLIQATAKQTERCPLGQV